MLDNGIEGARGIPRHWASMHIVRHWAVVLNCDYTTATAIGQYPLFLEYRRRYVPALRGGAGAGPGVLK